jgi:hypothetical protein
VLREMPNWQLLAIRVVVSGSIYGLIAWIAFRMDRGIGMLALAFFSPIIGVAIARPLVELSHEGMSWLWHNSMEDWQGYYHQFNGVQVRVYEHEGETWLVARDVIKASGMPPIPEGVLEERAGECGPIGETGLIGFTPAGVEKFLAEHPGPDAGKLVLWMRREVLRMRVLS